MRILRFFWGGCSLFLLLALTALPTQAATPPVVINELAWAGTTESSSDEWIELYNPSDSSIDLADWQLHLGDTVIVLTGTIAAQDYFLLERTDDDSVTSVVADQIYVGSLSNSGVDVVLHNADSVVIDSAAFATDGWPAGDNAEKLTLERNCDPQVADVATAWQSSTIVNGTPAAKNTNCTPTEDNDTDENDTSEDSHDTTEDDLNQEEEVIEDEVVDESSTESDENMNNESAEDSQESEQDVIQCELTETQRTCIADGMAEIVSTYNDTSCGTAVVSQETDASCGCMYTVWQDAQCTTDNNLQQTRAETSGHSYCTADLTREVADSSCETPLPTHDYTVQGKTCLRINSFLQCEMSQTLLDKDGQYMTIAFPEFDTSWQTDIIRTIDGPHFAYYSLSTDEGLMTLFINKRRSRVFGYGPGMMFKGDY